MESPLDAQGIATLERIEAEVAQLKKTVDGIIRQEAMLREGMLMALWEMHEQVPHIASNLQNTSRVCDEIQKGISNLRDALQYLSDALDDIGTVTDHLVND